MRGRRSAGLLQLELLEGLTAESLFLGARRWAGLTIAPFVLTALTGLLTLAGMALLLRGLPSREAGTLSLLLALVDTFSLVGSLGQTSLVTRIYGAANRADYDWLLDLSISAGFSVIPVALATLTAALIYDFHLSQLAFLAVTALLTVVNNVGCFMLNGHGHYIVSSFLLRLPNSLLLLAGALATASADWASLPTVLTLYTAGLVLSIGLLLLSLGRLLRRGLARISLRDRFEGLAFFASNSLALLPDQGVVAIAGALISPDRLATYAAMAILLRPFRLVTQVISGVMTPELIRRERPNYRGLLIGVWSLAVGGSLATILLGPAIARWAYGGRYAEGLELIPLLAAVGGLQVMAILPKSDLTGRASMRTFQRLVLSLTVVMGALAALSVPLISRGGLFGIGLSALSLQTARWALAYGFWRAHRRAAAWATSQPINRR